MELLGRVKTDAGSRPWRSGKKEFCSSGKVTMFARGGGQHLVEAGGRGEERSPGGKSKAGDTASFLWAAESRYSSTLGREGVHVEVQGETGGTRKEDKARRNQSGGGGVE